MRYALTTRTLSVTDACVRESAPTSRTHLGEEIMRRVATLAGGLVAVLALSGCAIHDREWGACAIGGAIVGGAAGGVASGAALNNTGHPSDGERAGVIIGSTIG